MYAIRLMALAALGVCSAPAQLMRVMVAEVKPDHVLEFRDLQKKATAAYAKAGTAYRAVYAPAGIGEQNVWYGFTPLAGFGEFDAPVVEKAMGEEYRDFIAQARHCVTNVRYEVVERRGDLTIDEGPRPGGLYSVAQLQIRPGHEAAFEEKYKVATAALKKMGLKTFLVSRVRYGNEIGLYRIGIALTTYAELDKGQMLSRAMGAEAYAKWRASVAEHISSVKYQVVKLDAELSYKK
jgi:hypothetical protein